MACPDCGSDKAVDKATAWDAATSIPKKARDELDGARSIIAAVRDIMQFDVSPPSDEHACYSVRVDLMDELAAAVGTRIRHNTD